MKMCDEYIAYASMKITFLYIPEQKGHTNPIHTFRTVAMTTYNYPPKQTNKILSAAPTLKKAVTSHTYSRLSGYARRGK